MRIKKVLFLLSLFAFSFSNAQYGMLNGTGYAADITVTDINGNSHNLYSYLNNGKVVVLELFSTTCSHCQQYAAGTENSYQAYGPNGMDVAEFIGLEVNSSTTNNDVANFATTYGVGFPLCNNISPTTINYQLYYTPSYYVIFPDSTYETFCPAYCQQTSSVSTIEGLINTAIQSWIPPVYGCTDPLAVNYNYLATIDDGTCDFTSYLVKTMGLSFLPDTIICDVGDTINFIMGQSHNAVEVNQSTYVTNGTTSNGGFNIGFGQTGTFIPTTAQSYYYVCQPHVNYGMKGVIIAYHTPVFGCTNPIACNYDSLATVDDNSCVFEDNPISNMSAYNYTLSFHWGCSGIIYNSEMEFDSSGSAIVNPGTVGATNVSWSLCDSVLTWVYTDGTQYTSTLYDNGTFIGTMISGSRSSTGCFTLTPIIAGCLDSTSLLYNPQANVDDGSCCAHYLRLNMYSSWPGGWSGGIYWTMMDDNGDTVISTALTYNSSTDTYHNVDYICIPDGCYTIVCSNGGGSGGISWTLKDDSTNSTIVSGGCPFGPYITAIGTSCVIMGCTDPNANNYYPHANLDDGSCAYSCGAITGVYMSDIIHDRATFNWDNMNSPYCQVDQIRIRYREMGTSSWSTKTMGVPVGSGCNTSNTSKRILSLSANTTYEYKFKIWYCNASTVIWHADGTFTTLPVCDNVTNVTATPITITKTQFCWDSVSTYAFVRLQYREDVPGSSFSNIGGMGVFSPILCKDKNGLTSGTQYRVMWRTWCNPAGGPYRSPVWEGPIVWDQPSSIRISNSTSKEKELVKVTDILGREVNPEKVIDNTTLFYIYSDGSVEKKIKID